MKECRIFSVSLFLLITAFNTCSLAQGTYQSQPMLDSRIVKILYYEGLQSAIKQTITASLF